MGRRRRVLHGIVLLGGIAALWAVASFFLPSSYTADQLRAAVAAYGAWAPAVMMGFQIVQVVVAPIPNQAAAIASGYLFGAWLGTLYTAVGTTLGGVIAFLLSRWIGRPAAEFVLPEETISRLYEVVEGADAPLLIALFLVPLFPGDALCYAAGLGRIRLRVFLVAAVVGRFPKFVVYTVFGDRFADAGFWAAVPYLLPLVIASIAVYWKRDAVRQLVQ
ncbi:MAG: VTT domain-containing protein [Candidatus Nanohaloarchaea archaeon]|nr:VTT domain-containing protein [Candidatus Nanohaloarchaea archaeon]